MSLRHGGLPLAAILACAAPLSATPPPVDGLPPAVNSRVLNIGYSTHSSTQPLRKVDLWVTTDNGEPWQHYASEIGQPSSIQFHAERDGLYGFFLVLRNNVGASSGPPQPGQQPHRWVLVDTAPPLVQIKQVRLIRRDPPDSPLLVVSWAAYDAQLEDRPVSLYYQLDERASWQALASNIADVGRFDWAIPPKVSGRITVKIEIRDRAGNVASDISSPIMVQAPAPVNNAAQAMPEAPTLVKTPPDVEANRPGAEAQKLDPERARELYELGVWHKQRGDYGLAVTRLIEAMNHAPNILPPAYELANIYYAQGNYNGALDIYKGILEHQSTDRQALRGTALAKVALRQYPDALQYLERVLQATPNDEETWLHAGDVFLLMGQRDPATQYWREAARISPVGTDVARQAQKRLERYGQQRAADSK